MSTNSPPDIVDRPGAYFVVGEDPVMVPRGVLRSTGWLRGDADQPQGRMPGGVGQLALEGLETTAEDLRRQT